MLNTKDENNAVLTATANRDSPEVVGPTICRVEAVTPERKVEMTVRSVYALVSSLCTNLMVFTSLNIM